MPTACKLIEELAMINKEKEKDQMVQKQGKPHLFHFFLFLSSHHLSIALFSFSQGLPLALIPVFIVGQKYISLQLELMK